MSRVVNESDNAQAIVKSSVIGKSPAQRRDRLSHILNVDPLAIIVTNRRARIGLKPTTISRFEATPAKPTAGRIGPKAVGAFDTRLLLERTRRAPRRATE